MLSKTIRLGTALLDELRDTGDVLMTRARRLAVSRPVGPIRLTVVQFGDYGEAYWRFANGGEENYYAQRYSVDFVASLAGRSDVDDVTVVCLAANAPATQLPNGVRTLGVE